MENARPDGCFKHVAASLYQLVDFFDSGPKEVPGNKTCTDLLQKWHILEEKRNKDALLFQDLVFEKTKRTKITPQKVL